MHEENLSQFSSLSAEAVDELWSLLAGNVSDVPEIEVSDTKLPRLIEIMQRVEEAAAESDMSGLQTLCAMVEANLQTIYTEGRHLNPSELGVLEEWPELLMGYVISQGDESSVDLLLKNMMSAKWPLPMSSEDVEVLRHMFVVSAAEESTPTSQFADFQEKSQFEESIESIAVVIAKDPLVAESIAMIDLPSEEVQEVDSEMIKMLNKEFALMAEQINEDLSAAVSKHFSAQQRRVALANYAELIERLGMASESVGLSVLGKIFAQFKQKLQPFQAIVQATTAEHY